MMPIAIGSRLLSDLIQLISPSTLRTCATAARAGRVHANRDRGLVPFAQPTHRPTPGVTSMNMHEAFSPSEAEPSNVTAPARTTWLRSISARLVAWVKTCADHYAAAAAYDGLSRLSDPQLHHRGLSRDILARDLSAGREQAFEHLGSAQSDPVPPSLGVVTMIRCSFQRDARARAFQAAAILLVLFAVLAGFVLNRDTTHMAARTGSTPPTAQPAIERF